MVSFRSRRAATECTEKAGFFGSFEVFFFARGAASSTRSPFSAEKPPSVTRSAGGNARAGSLTVSRAPFSVAGRVRRTLGDVHAAPRSERRSRAIGSRGSPRACASHDARFFFLARRARSADAAPPPLQVGSRWTKHQSPSLWRKPTAPRGYASLGTSTNTSGIRIPTSKRAHSTTSSTSTFRSTWGQRRRDRAPPSWVSPKSKTRTEATWR